MVGVVKAVKLLLTLVVGWENHDRRLNLQSRSDTLKSSAFL
ncbi:uncharacterized protein METZ01_LOCUS317512, partial [marine metagenome]